MKKLINCHETIFVMKGLKLKVAEAHQDDVNKGLVRVDSRILRSIGISPGEIVGILGERETVSIADRSYPSDLGLEIVRMDGMTRKNAKVGVGELIEIFKPEVKPAQRVVLSPTQELILHPGTKATLEKGLIRKPLKQGDIISVSRNNFERRRTLQSNNPFEIGLFNLIEGEFLGFNLNTMKFKVSSTKPDGFLQIVPQTRVEITSKSEEESQSQGINYEDVGGLKSQLEKVRELIELPLKHPEIFTRLGIEAPKGILLYGPPGTGKTLLARAIANETEATFYSISAPEIVNKYYGESEKKLRELFDKAQKDSPAVIFIDEIDAIAAKREEVQGEAEKRIVAQLLTLMDGLNKSNKVIVIAATNRPQALDEALRRPGRFDRELEIGVPKEDDRLEILKIHTRGMPLAIPKNFKVYKKILKEFVKKHENAEIDVGKIEKDFKENPMAGLSQLPKEVVEQGRKEANEKMLEEFAKVTHGFVGADLGALVKEAAFNVLRRNFPAMDLKDDKRIPKEVLNKLEIGEDDFKKALSVVRPSAMREYYVEVPDVKWGQVGGLEDLKQQLTEMIEWPLKSPESFSRLGIRAPKGILLYGPPGTGKTLLAKAVATETSSNFIYIKGPEILGKYVGESEKQVRKIFEKAKQNAPCILFFDEFDAIAGTRLGKESGKNTDTIVNQILTEMDGLEELINVKVLAATNRPGLIDPALLRPGRFDKLMLVDVPDLEARKSILRVHLSKTPTDDKEKLVEELAKKTEGYVGADLEALIREAGLITLRRERDATSITRDDFLEALKVVPPSVNSELHKHYKEIESEMRNPRKAVESLSMNSYI